MMHFLLFIFYFVAACFAITRTKFLTQTVRPVYLVIFFSLHVAAGCLHTWIAFRFFPNHGDIWSFFSSGIYLKQLLIQHPRQFFYAIIHSGNWLNIIDQGKPVLDIQYQFLQYLNALLNFLSFDNLYINTLFFSIPVFCGSMALFKVFHRMFSSPLTACCTILLPSVLFWTSVVYKDGLVYTALGYFLYLFLPVSKINAKRAALMLFWVAVLVLSRANILISFFPAVFFLGFTEKRWLGKGGALVLTLLSVAACAVIINSIVSGALLERIVQRQFEYQLLEGGSNIYLPVLSPTIGSFIDVFPYALLNGFFQPLPGSAGKLVYSSFSAELLTGWLLVLAGSWQLIRRRQAMDNFSIACLLFALTGLIMIGYIVPFTGAIVRYRSVYLPFLLAPFIQAIVGTGRFTIIASVNKWLGSHIMTENGHMRS